MKFYFAEFKSPLYLSDDEIFQPGYKTEEEAEARCVTEARNAYDPRFPALYQSKTQHYYVRELEVDV
jgi:hypothetical protein